MLPPISECPLMSLMVSVVEARNRIYLLTLSKCMHRSSVSKSHEHHQQADNSHLPLSPPAPLHRLSLVVLAQ